MIVHRTAQPSCCCNLLNLIDRLYCAVFNPFRKTVVLV